MISQKTAQLIKFIVFITFSIFLTITGFVLFQIRTTKIFTATGDNYLTNITNLYGHTLKIKLEKQLISLEAQTNYFENTDLENITQVKRIIEKNEYDSNFKTIFIVSNKGTVISYSEAPIEDNISHNFKNVFFSEAPEISKSIVMDDKNEPVLAFAAPIKNNNTVTGLLIGTIDYNRLNEIFIDYETTDYYKNFIIDKQGNVIIGNRDSSRITKVYEFINRSENTSTISASQISHIYSDIKEGKSGKTRFKLNGKRNSCIYSPIYINDWYIVSIITTTFLDYQQNKLGVAVFTLFLTLFIAVCLTSYVIRQIYKEYKNSKNDLERFSIVNNFNHALVFSINFKNGIVEFSGEVNKFSNIKEKSITLEEFKKVYNRIHPDDATVIDHLKESIKNKQSDYTTEFRYKNNDENYEWYRLSSTLIFDEKHNVNHLVCNLINVDEQVTHELELKQIAETDMLSGLFNKFFYTQKIKECLAEDEINNGALFIIDLDNFKSINDNLGHSIGDIAIRDAAKKITLVFSEKDFIGRIGGDEFSVFLCLDNSIPEETAKKIIKDKAEKICEVIYEEYANDNKSVEVTSSVGIAIYPSDGEDFGTLFEKADSALYNVKQNGKDGYKIYSSDLTESGESKYM